LSLKFKGVDAQTGERINANLTIVYKGEGKFDLQIRRADPDTGKQFNVGTIKFNKR